MKSSLINPIGTSPMVVTEMVKFFLTEYKKPITDVVILATNNENVLSGAYMAGSALKVNYPKIRVHYEFLTSSDVRDFKDIINLVDRIGEIVKNERNNHNVDNVYLNVSGGRKVESIILSNFSQLLKIDEVWAVVNLNIQNYNIEYERYKDELVNFRNGENIEYYKKNSDKFDPIFFPDSDLSFFEIPSIKLSRDDLNLLKTLLKGIDLEDSNIPEYKIGAFIASGLLGNNKKRSVPTELGEVIMKYL